LWQAHEAVFLKMGRVAQGILATLPTRQQRFRYYIIYRLFLSSEEMLAVMASAPPR
jgi:hypothetical protein